MSAAVDTTNRASRTSAMFVDASSRSTRSASMSERSARIRAYDRSSREHTVRTAPATYADVTSTTVKSEATRTRSAMDVHTIVVMCRDPSSPSNVLTRTVLEYGAAYLFIAVEHIEDDDKCIKVLGALRVSGKGLECIAASVFASRSLDCYHRFQCELPSAWTPHSPTLYALLQYKWSLDVSNKVRYMLLKHREPHFIREEGLGPPWSTIVAMGLNDREDTVRCQFPAVLSSLAVFLVGVPPRVQCRVLENTRMVLAM